MKIKALVAVSLLAATMPTVANAKPDTSRDQSSWCQVFNGKFFLWRPSC